MWWVHVQVLTHMGAWRSVANGHYWISIFTPHTFSFYLFVWFLGRSPSLSPELACSSLAANDPPGPPRLHLPALQMPTGSLGFSHGGQGSELRPSRHGKHVTVWAIFSPPALQFYTNISSLNSNLACPEDASICLQGETDQSAFDILFLPRH